MVTTGFDKGWILGSDRVELACSPHVYVFPAFLPLNPSQSETVKCPGVSVRVCDELETCPGCLDLPSADLQQTPSTYKQTDGWRL